MKLRHTILYLLLICATWIHGQNWTGEELSRANTAKDCPYMNQVEKDVVLYNNLARMYPAKFAQIELRSQRETAYLTSLRQDLNTMRPAQPLYVNRAETESAKCWAAESGRRGIVGHDRVGCSNNHVSEQWGENCSYGANTGRDIVIQLLIDEGITGLGHRRNCLNPSFQSMGVGFAMHSVYTCCCVMDFVTVSGENYGSQQAKPANSPSPLTAAVTAVPAPDSDSKSVVQPTPTHRFAQPETATAKPKKSSYLQRYFDHSGKHMLSFLSVGYSYSFWDKHHLLNLSVLDFRATLFGASLLNAEFAIRPFDKRFSYKPEIRVYVPITASISVVPYGGVVVDASYLGQLMSKSYQYNLNTDFYVNIVGGVAFNFSGVAHVPLEIKAEYRYRLLPGTIDPTAYSGFYIGVQLYMVKPFIK